jgi:hypothetical protein
MKLGAYTACLHDLPLPETLKILRDMELTSAEINAGGFISAPHLPAAHAGGRAASWVANPWDSQFLDTRDYQWGEVVIPFWTDIESRARDAEMDPSHLFWQGIDPAQHRRPQHAEPVARGRLLAVRRRRPPTVLTKIMPNGRWYSGHGLGHSPTVRCSASLARAASSTRNVSTASRAGTGCGAPCSTAAARRS